MRVTPCTNDRYKQRAFTLVELVIVILILGILAGVAAPRLFSVSSKASQRTFAQQLHVFYEAVERYYMENQTYPAESASGVLPTELESYLLKMAFGNETAIGGLWDYQANSYGFIAGIGVHFPSGKGYPGDSVMQEIDQLIDDGNTSTGAFQAKDGGNRFYFIKK